MRTAWYGLATVVTVTALPFALGATLAAGVNGALTGLARGLHLRGARTRRIREKKRRPSDRR